MTFVTPELLLSSADLEQHGEDIQYNSHQEETSGNLCYPDDTRASSHNREETAERVEAPRKDSLLVFLGATGPASRIRVRTT